MPKQPRIPWQIYCPACQFTFERTKVAIARSWAIEHNTKIHSGTLVIRDITQPD